MTTTFTTKLNLGKPEDGDSGWGEVYRDSMDELESRLTKTHAGDPNSNVAGDFVGQLCLDSTNGLIYRCTTAGIAASAVWSAVTVKDGAITSAKLASSIGGVPVGGGMDYWGTTAPSGYIFAYGQAISRSTYSALFAALGTTYGAGNGSTTFNVPDKRGRASFGKDNMGGTSANRLTNSTSQGINGDTLGDVGGEEDHTMTTAEMVSHSHSAGSLSTSTTGAHVHTGGVASGSSIQSSGGSAGSGNTGSAGSHNHDVTGSTATAGSSNAFNVLPPGIVCNYVIFAGVYS